MSFTIVDGVVLAVLALSGILAWSRGLTREALAIAGWVVAAIVALYAAPFLEPLLQEIPVAGEILAGACTLSKLAAFSVAFAIVLILLSIFTPLFSSAVQDSILGPVDKALGFVFGVARGVLLVAVVYIVYDQVVPPADRLAMVDQSRSVAMISEAATLISERLPTTLPDWAIAPINGLMNECGGVPALSGTNQA
ncbi:CvpA family protein [Albimonas sp. CAU 1670]|uniref:CvpA family protein n=1 Tax=Albimonas sp. CAU 1670 TaxID=3032599 RepID=UPI0023DA2BD0|nr:CvpA family protein [Albimonas sp. CAU 1670]MDF2232013.1 CvpA family protein [Albimonas sp. CAU 1670]